MSAQIPSDALRWYLCERKQALDLDAAQARAALLGLAVFPCEVGGDHYHIGTPSGRTTAKTRDHARRALRRDIEKGRIYLGGRPVPLED